MIQRLRQMLRVAPAGQLRPDSSFERPVVILLCAAIAAVPATLTWIASRPLPDAAISEWIGTTLVAASFGELNTMVWRETLRQGAGQRSWRTAGAFLRRRVPAMQPVTGGVFGSLSAAAQEELRAAAGWDNEGATERRQTEEALERIAVAHRDSLPAQYTLARWYVANDEPRRALAVVDDFFARVPGVWQVQIAGPDRAYAALGDLPASQREVAARILFRYLAGEAAIFSQVPDQAIPHLRVAIGYSNALEQVATRPQAANTRMVDLLAGSAGGVIEGEPGEPFTTTTLYDALVVAYWQSEAFDDSAMLRSRELIRRPNQQAPGDALFDVMAKATETQAPIPDHGLWTVSNLQRIAVENERDLSARHLGLEASICALLVEQPKYLGAAADDGLTRGLRARASGSLLRAWTTASTERVPPADLLRPLLAWSGSLFDAAAVQRLVELDSRSTLLVAASDLAKEWKPLAQIARWTLQIGGRGFAQAVRDSDDAREGRGPNGPLFTAAEDRRLLAVWRRTLLNAYVEALRNHVYDQIAAGDADPQAFEQSVAVFIGLTQATGRRAYDLMRARMTARQSLPWRVERDMWLADYRWWLIGVAGAAGLIIWWMLWSIYVNLCRYRLVIHGHFYRDEQLWLVR
jgi:hypothetical protein